MKTGNTAHFQRLRHEYAFLAFEDMDIRLQDHAICVTYHFNLADRHHFSPTLTIPYRPFYSDFHLLPANPGFRYLVFQAGMAEMISYWKAACPPRLIIKPYSLSAENIQWWKKLYYYGLGEFFYINGIELEEEEVIEIIAGSPSPPLLNLHTPSKKTIVPIGGGKDSVVSLTLLQHHLEVIPFLLNPGKAMIHTLQQAGIEENAAITFQRTLDPLLLSLNEQGFLNGHTPFSALLAFYTTLAAAITGTRFIALSNESSANEPTIPGTHINHQYSKSFAFESDFRQYLREQLTIPVEYFSFLRPLLEIQIAQLFSRYPQHFHSFRSCNAGSKTGTWCGLCPKCLFAFIILSPFVERGIMKQIFGSDLLDQENQWEHLRQLCGMAETKPFECIGTLEEVNTALELTAQQIPKEEHPLLITRYLASRVAEGVAIPYREIANRWDTAHYLPRDFEIILREAWKHFNF